MNILFIGDVFGQPGREALLRWLPGFRVERAVDFVIANGENAANGAGITSKIALKLLAGGVDVIRVHDVLANCRAARMCDAIVRGGVPL